MAFHLQGWEHCWGEEWLNEAGLPASLVWMEEAGAEGEGRAEAGAERPERAGGAEEALILHCCEDGQAQQDWPGFDPASSLALFSSSLWKISLIIKLKKIHDYCTGVL